MPSQGKVKIDAEFESLIPAMTAEEYEGLEKQLQSEGCRDAFVVWGNHHNTLLDGHHRYKLCVKHGLPYPVPHKLEFESRDDAKNWVINNQLGRRNISAEQRRYLLGKLYIAAKRHPGQPEKNSEKLSEYSADQIAEEHGVTARTLQNAEHFANALDAAAEKAPEVKDAVLAGTHATTEQLETIAELPAKEAKKVASAVKFGKPVKEALNGVAKPKKKDDWEGGGEPHEALKPLGEIAASIGKAVRAWDAARKVVDFPELQKVHDGLDTASIANEALRTKLRRNGK